MKAAAAVILLAGITFGQAKSSSLDQRYSAQQCHEWMRTAISPGAANERSAEELKLQEFYLVSCMLLDDLTLGEVRNAFYSEKSIEDELHDKDLIAAREAAAGPKPQDSPPDTSRPAHATNTMDEIYRDESHCLNLPEIRSDKDAPISCYCRDAIADARYVYFTYLRSAKDVNLSGVVLALQQRASEQCKYDAIHSTEAKDWKWNGPEVVRTYPPEDVIERISPEKVDGKPTGRWVPFTVQLVYRDVQGRVTRTENYSSREFEPAFPK